MGTFELNLERGVQTLVHKAPPENFWVAIPTSGHVNAFMMHKIIVATDW